MADLAESGDAADGFNNVVRGFCARLVNHEGAVEGSRLWRSWHVRDSIRGRVVLSAGRGLAALRRLALAKKVLDVLAVLLGLIENERDLRRTPQLQAFDQFVANETRRRRESF